jgi:co-chaperonin GroES (HSP10)
MKILRPLGNRVLVELVRISNKTESGFILSNEDKTEQQKGKVLAVGIGYGEEKDLLNNVKVGDVVFFSRYGGEDIKDQSGEVIQKIINITDIFAVEK